MVVAADYIVMEIRPLSIMQPKKTVLSSGPTQKLPHAASAAGIVRGKISRPRENGSKMTRIRHIRRLKSTFYAALRQRSIAFARSVTHSIFLSNMMVNHATMRKNKRHGNVAINGGPQ